MLTHGAIIASKLEVPCVNGIASAVEFQKEDEIIIVGVGSPEVDLEAA